MSFALLKALESPSLAWPTAAPAASFALLSTSWSANTLLNQGCDTRQARQKLASFLMREALHRLLLYTSHTGRLHRSIFAGIKERCAG